MQYIAVAGGGGGPTKWALRVRAWTIAMSRGGTRRVTREVAAELPPP
jgi:hypothetical protein